MYVGTVYFDKSYVLTESYPVEEIAALPTAGSRQFTSMTVISVNGTKGSVHIKSYMTY